jgi:hypothetical protein
MVSFIPLVIDREGRILRRKRYADELPGRAAIWLVSQLLSD